MSALGLNSCSGASLVQLEKNLVFITASSSRIFYMQVDLGFPFHELNCYSLAFENSVILRSQLQSVTFLIACTTSWRTGKINWKCILVGLMQSNQNMHISCFLFPVFREKKEKMVSQDWKAKEEKKWVMKWACFSLEKRGKEARAQRQVIEENIWRNIRNLLAEPYWEAAEKAVCGTETTISRVMQGKEAADEI